MTDPSSTREKNDGRRRACEQTAESQVQVNTDKDQVVGNAIDDTALAAFAMGQTRELAVRVVERIRANMEHHPHHVDA